MSTDERRARAAYEALRDYNCPQHICGDCEPKYPDCTCKQNAREVLRAIRASDEAALGLRPDQLQPDADSPGLYIQCATTEQRRQIMAMLAAATESDNG